jgi:hypothetical protein
MNFTFRIILFLLGLISMPGTMPSQAFFKVLEEPDGFFNQQVRRFDNGGILLGDSSLESLRQGGINGEVYLPDFLNVVMLSGHLDIMWMRDIRSFVIL